MNYLTAKEYWKSKFDEPPQNDADKLAVAMMADYAEYVKSSLPSPAMVVEDGWIDVKDRLPEIGEYVFVYNTEGAILIARLFTDGWAAFFADGEKLMGELSATHWMPLPNPPKQ